MYFCGCLSAYTMETKPFFPKLLALLLLSSIFNVALMAQVATRQHTVEKGETVYRISKKYGLTVEQLLQYNPGLTAENLTAGKVLAIPVVAGDSATLPQTHKVKKGETIWGISQQYGITPEDLMEANPELKKADSKLKKGMEIKIPRPKPAPAPPVAEKPQGLNCVKVAVVLPFKSAKSESNRCTEYYRGFLMAVDKIKQEGKDIEIYAYNEPASGNKLDSLLQEIKRHKVHLLIGPVYPQHVQELADFTKKEGVKLLVPFSSKVSQVSSHPGLFLVNAPDGDKFRYVANLFIKTFPTDIVPIMLGTQKKNESAFSSYLSKRLSEQKYEVKTLQAEYTNDELKSLLSVSRPAIIIPDASDHKSLEQILTRLAAFKKKYPGFNISLFGYPEWQTYNSASFKNLHAVNTYIFTNFYYNSYSSDIQKFESEYKKWFNTPLAGTFPRMELLGYDSGICMMSGILKFGMDFGSQVSGAKMFQSDIRFGRLLPAGGYINQCLWFIHYKLDGTIEKISAY